MPRTNEPPGTLNVYGFREFDELASGEKDGKTTSMLDVFKQRYMLSSDNSTEEELRDRLLQAATFARCLHAYFKLQNFPKAARRIMDGITELESAAYGYYEQP